MVYLQMAFWMDDVRSITTVALGCNWVYLYFCDTYICYSDAEKLPTCRYWKYRQYSSLLTFFGSKTD